MMIVRRAPGWDLKVLPQYPPILKFQGSPEAPQHPLVDERDAGNLIQKAVQRTIILNISLMPNITRAISRILRKHFISTQEPGSGLETVKAGHFHASGLANHVIPHLLCTERSLLKRYGSLNIGGFSPLLYLAWTVPAVQYSPPPKAHVVQQEPIVS